MLTIHLALTFALVCQQPGTEAQQVTPQGECAKIFNRSDRSVGFDYRFEDDQWRPLNIAPKAAVYIYQVNPKFALTVRFSTGGTWKSYSLDTSSVWFEDSKEGQPTPNLKRNDQAVPYTFRLDGNGRLEMFRGFPRDLIQKVAETTVARLRRNGLDPAVLTATVAPERSDIIFNELELLSACKIVSDAYQELMKTDLVPEVNVRWMSIDASASTRHLRPRLSVSECTGKVGTAVLFELLRSSLASVDADLVVDVTECSSTQRWVPRLHPRYIDRGAPLTVKLRRDIGNSIGQSTLGWDHEHNDGPKGFRICSNWQIVRRNGKDYRWKTTIAGNLDRDSAGHWGLILTTRFVGQKHTGSWEALSDLVVSRMGDLEITSFSPNSGKQASGPPTLK